MRKTKNILLIIAVIVIVGCLLYIPCMNKLGLYRDDWNNYYNAVVRGADMLNEHYSSDRPADGFLLSLMFRVFKTNNLAYHIYNLCCRILGAVFLALTLLIVWPRTPKMAGLAGVLAVAFPGFLQQVDGIAYVPHQTAMLCFLFSLWLTALACEPNVKRMRAVLTFISMLFSFASMMLMEYYIGMEIYRFALIYLLNREQAQNGKPKAFFKCILYYLPYLIPALGFVAWRAFFFNAERAGADVMEDLIRPFLAHPRHELALLGVRFLKNVWKLFAGVWTIPAFNLINGLDMKAFIYTLIPVAVIFAVSQLFLFLMHRRRTDESVLDARNESAQWLWCGLISGTIAILPLVVAERDINFSASLDRFSWPGMIGTILFLIGLLGSLKDRSLRNILTMAAVFLAIFVQWQNKVNYVDQWKRTQDFWQQLMWRAPGLEEGTTIVTQGALLIEEDYDVFAPASLIYYADEAGWSPIGAEVLNTDTVRQIHMGKKTDRRVREIFVEKDYQKLIALSKPTDNACLRVIDGSNPIYSLDEWTRIPEIGAYSRTDQIILNPEKQAAIPFFLGEEQPHGWCYYYEKMELALQGGDPNTAAALADEAFAQKLSAGDNVELIPVIEAYTQTRRIEDALSYVEKLKENEYMSRSACAYFSAKEDSGAYGEVTAMLCGAEAEASADEPTGTATAETPEGSAEVNAEPSAEAPADTSDSTDTVTPEETVEEAAENSAETTAPAAEVPADVTETADTVTPEEMAEIPTETTVPAADEAVTLFINETGASDESAPTAEPTQVPQEIILQNEITETPAASTGVI